MVRVRVILALLLVMPMSALALAAELSGHVVGTAQAPLHGVVVVVATARTTIRTTTDATGAFSVELPGPPPDRVDVTVSAEGYRRFAVTVHDLTVPLVVALEPSGVFSEQVEVTATRARAGETPVTFTNVGRKEIERGYWGQDVPIFLSQVPGFYAYNDNGNGIGYSYFTLRGFSMARVGVTLNGVPLNDAEEHGVFFIDLADFLSTTGDIQVQRGVGTSLYGTNTIGGSVDLQTRHPLSERRLRMSGTLGSWDTRMATVEYDTGLLDGGWAATFRWTRVDTNGYRDQSWVNMWNYYMDIEHYGERSNLRLVLFGGPEETHLAYDGVSRAYLEGEVTDDRRRDRRFNPLEYPGQIDHFFQPHEQLIHTWQLSDDLTLENTLFYFQGDGYYDQFKSGADFLQYDLQPFTGPDGDVVDSTDLVRRRSVQESDGGWIGQLRWSHDGGRGTLQGGVAVRLHQGHHFGEVRWAQYYPPTLDPDHRYYDYEVDKKVVQPFVQETWHMGPRWTLLGGLTATDLSYSMGKDRRNGVTVDADYGWVLPRLGVGFRPAAGWNLFANVSRGAREPAFRDIYDPQDYWATPNHLAHEELTDYEVGTERRWAAGFAKLNAYLMHFDNEIVWAGALDDNGVPVTANGAVTNHRGIEAEVGLDPVPRWGGHLAMSWSHNTFEDFREYDYDGNFVDYSGNRIAGVADLLATLQLSGGIGSVDVLLVLRHVGRFYLDNTEDLRKSPDARSEPGYIHRVNPSFTSADLSFKIDLGHLVADALSARKAALDVRVNNLTDELYTTFGYMDWPDPRWTPAATRSVYTGLTVDW